MVEWFPCILGYLEHIEPPFGYCGLMTGARRIPRIHQLEYQLRPKMRR